MKKTIFISQIMQTIFIILLITIALLQNIGAIELNKSLTPLYIILILGYTFVLTIIYIILMAKYKQNEKFIGIQLIIIVIELFLLAIFCTGVDNRIDKINFRKQSGETKATIYRIKQIKNWDKEKERKKINYIYYFKYSAMGKDDCLGSYTTSNNLYKEGDLITVYYNKENPEDYRLSISYLPFEFLSIILVIITGFRVFGFLRLNYYKES